jgi:hypothetical protein
MLPFSYHVIIGFFVGFFCLVRLSDRDVREAFARNQLPGRRQRRQPAGGVASRVRSALGGMLTLLVHRPTAAAAVEPESRHDVVQFPERMQPTPVQQAKPTDPGAGPRPAAHVVAKMAIGCAICLVPVLAVLVLLWLTGTFDSPSGDGGSTAVRWKQDPSLAFHRGNLHVLELYGQEYTSINNVFRAADQEYLMIEARHTRANYDDATSDLVVTVMPFSEELKSLEDRVWLQMAAILEKQRLEKAKLLLPLRGSLFPFGKEKVKIALNWTNDGGYRWRLLPVADDGGLPPYQRGRELPIEYVRFWSK